MENNFVDNQDDELLKTDTELDNDATNTTDTDTNIDDNNDTSNNEESNDNVEDSDEDEVTQEQLDSLDDDQFAEFLNTGKLPKANKPTPEKAKVISKPEVKEEKPVEPKVNESEVPTEDIDYKAVYESIFKPFKANGKELTPRNVEDVISLMQRGANYTKKMQLLAPVKRAYESLTKADIKEEDLNFLIDIHKGDTEAIKQLLQRHNIDPIDLDIESTNYKAHKNNIATDADVEFSDVLRDIDSSLPKIQDIMTNKWDEASKQELIKNPKLLRALHEEIELGRFDEVQARVELEKTFGKYQGYSDLQAYIDVVSKMVSEKKSQQVTQPKAEPRVRTTPTNVPDKSKAAPVRSKPKNQGVKMTVQDLLSMSDDDFNKLNINDLM